MSKNSIENWDKNALKYAELASDKVSDAYEFEINNPSLFSLLPKKGKTIVDVGTDSGEIIPLLTKRFNKVIGTDASSELLNISKMKYPNIKFYLWDIEKPFKESIKADVIFCKLVLMFVKDLNKVAKEFNKLLIKDGICVVSVTHPIYWYKYYLEDKHGVISRKEFKVMELGYFSSNVSINKNVGDSNFKVEYIHHTIEEYVSAFTKNGFNLVELLEPRITNSFIKRHPNFSNDKMGVPMRLNLKFKKV